MSEDKATVTVKKDVLWKLALGILVILLIVSFFTGGFRGGSNSNSGSNNGNNGDSDGGTSNIQVSITDRDPILGDANAQVSIVEFSDFQCPFCARAHFGALADFKSSDYFKNGQVNLVYKHLPLTSIHQYAQKSAEAAECARRQSNDKFWKYHDLLFANQDRLDTSSLKLYAEQIGLNVATFSKCLDDGEAEDKVSSDTLEALSAGGQGTPYFVIVNNNNDQTTIVEGAMPWANFEAAIRSVM